MKNNILNLFTKLFLLITSLCCSLLVMGQGQISRPTSNRGNKISNNSKAVKNKVSVSGSINGHDYVDLGLPSGLKWATCNVGASSPNDCGNYFAWGETRQKSNYDYNNCFDCLDSNGNQWSLYKIGGKTQITPTSGNDAARENWGGTWRMPTKSDWEELINRCKWVLIKKEGHRRYKVIGPNGKHIILPAGGHRSQSYLCRNLAYGDYWSSTLGPTYSHQAYFMSFSDGYHSVGECCRDYGLNVRPVTE